MTIEARKLHLIRRLIDIEDEVLLDKIELVLNSAASNDLEEKAWSGLVTDQFLKGYAEKDSFYESLDNFTPDFMEDRNQPAQQERESLN